MQIETPCLVKIKRTASSRIRLSELLIETREFKTGRYLATAQTNLPDIFEYHIVSHRK